MGADPIRLGEPTPALEGFVVPSTATMTASDSYEDDYGRYDSQTWMPPPDVTYDQLQAFFDTHLPLQQPSGEWDWCEVTRLEQTITRLYHQEGTALIAGAIIGEEDDATTFILISVDESGPC